MQCIKFCILSRIPLASFRESSGFLSSTVFNKVPLRNAGHSKWANIRHIKGLKDLQRSKDLTKFHQRMQVAVKEFGSPDPKKNSRLASVIQDAKDAKLPMASITRILDNIGKAKRESRKELWGLKGPGRSILLVEIFTDNRQKAKDDLNWYLKKGGGHSSQWIDSDVTNLFPCVGTILCSEYKGKPVQEELLEDSVAHAIDAGAEDVTFDDNLEYGKVLNFSCGQTGFYRVKQFLIDAGYTVVHTDIVHIPLTRIGVSDEDMQAAEVLINKLLEADIVVNVYDNIA